MAFQLYNAIVNPDNSTAYLFCGDTDNNKTTVKIFNIDNDIPTLIDTPTLAGETEFPVLIKSVCRIGNYLTHIYKASNNWDVPAFVQHRDWNTLAVAMTDEIKAEFFNFDICVAPDHNTTVLATFRDQHIKVYDYQGQKRIGVVGLNNTFYANGINFNSRSDRFGYITFDQGGGGITYVKKSNAGFQVANLFGHAQIWDDYSMNGNIQFDIDDSLIATTVYSATSFHSVKYNPETGDILWENKFDYKGDQETLAQLLKEQELDEEAYTNLVWNNHYRTAIKNNHLYLGANQKIIVINTETGVTVNKIDTGLKGFCMQLYPIERTHKIFVVDNTGECALITM
jgi:hypothetical protein